MFRNLNTAELREKFKSAKPFPFVVIDDFLEPEFARTMMSSYPTFENARSMGFEFNAVNEKKKIQVTDEALFPDAVKQFARLAQSEEFRRMLSEITGIEDLRWDPGYVGAGMHMTASSGRLDVHVDFNRLAGEPPLYRRINLLLFLNDGWQEEWGGKLELWNQDVSECAHSLMPLLNRLVMFETSDISFHGVTPVKCPPEVARRSFALYYYATEPPRGLPATSEHSTVFKARPNEFMRAHVLMPFVATRDNVMGVLRAGKQRALQMLGLKRA